MNIKHIFLAIIAVFSFTFAQSQDVYQKVKVNNSPETSEISVEVTTFGEKETTEVFEGDAARKFLISRNMNPNPIVKDGALVSDTEVKSSDVIIASTYVNGFADKSKVAKDAVGFMNEMHDDLLVLASNGVLTTEFSLGKMKMNIEISRVENVGGVDVVFIKEMKVTK